MFERDELLRDVSVLGEISNWKRAASGHCYFSLKDSGATLSAVMWRTAASSHTWLPSDGDQVIAHGYVGVYPERGAYQLYANRIMAAGRGQLYEPSVAHPRRPSCGYQGGCTSIRYGSGLESGLYVAPEIERLAPR